MSQADKRRKKKQQKDRLAKVRTQNEAEKAHREQLQAAQAEAARVASFMQVPVPTTDQETLHQLLDTGAAKVVYHNDSQGTLSIEAELAWEVDPWLWTAATDPVAPQKYLDVGTSPPVAVYVNRDYQVTIFDEPGPGNGWPEMWHLSFKRRDREPFHDWRIAQRIKNSIVGKQNEGVELYPSESRLVDTANQYHLFVIKDPEVLFPFGFSTRLVTDDEAHGSKQRVHPEDTDKTDPALMKKDLDQFYGTEDNEASTGDETAS